MHIGFSKYLWSPAAWVALAQCVAAQPLTFQIAPGAPNLVTFTSTAPLETIVGHTDKITGWLKVDPGDLKGAAAAEFEVDMASLDTDNRIRNGHMRANHLHTKQFPTSRFVLTGLGNEAPARLTDAAQSDFSITGDFTCHGVTHSIKPQVTAVWRSDLRTLEVTARFPVLLDDYGIPLPQFLIMKLDRKQEVVVRFTARAD